jgi:Fic family protein
MTDASLRDDGEATALFEPLMVADDSRHRPALNDLALSLAEKSVGFRRSMPPSIAAALADLVRSMNCYYSNLIEGHSTHPIDIEKALSNDYSAEPAKRTLQLEATAHIAVQRWIDGGGLPGRPTDPAVLCEIHRRFCALLPPELLLVEDPQSRQKTEVVPGAYRVRDVKVGRHVAVSPGAVPRFMVRFDQGYRNLGRIESVLAAACAHHRLLWIHPFTDGNGRVARLMSNAMLLQALDAGGLWSVSRGLAREEAAYKGHLAACDLRRRNDLDGRGTLSEEELASFTRFFLEICIDQIAFMEDLMRPDRLTDRILLWTEEEIRGGRLPRGSDGVMKATLFQGSLDRGAVPSLLGLSERAARRITASLIETGAIRSDSTRSPLLLAFPARFADRWMPGLFPGKRGQIAAAYRSRREQP